MPLPLILQPRTAREILTRAAPMSRPPPVSRKNIFQRVRDFAAAANQFAPQNIVKRVYNFAERAPQTSQKLVYNIMPIGAAASAAESGANLAGKAGRAAKTVFQRLTSNPYEGLGVGQVGRKLLNRIFGVGMTMESINLAYSAASGDPFNPIPSAAKVKDILAFAINPVAATVGLGAGFLKRGGVTAADVAGKVFGDSHTGPIVDYAIPSPIDFSHVGTLPHTPEINAALPDVSGAFTSPVGAFSPSFSVSADTGGGAGTAALLALLGLGGGYLLGKRKRKKYKRRKSKKQHGRRRA